MSEELLQRELLTQPPAFGRWQYYNIGATSLRALKSHKIIPDLDYETFEGRKPDALVADKGRVFAVVENKSPAELDTEAKIARHIAYWLPVARKVRSRLLILTDGTQSIWISTKSGLRIRNAKGEPLSPQFSPSSADSAHLLDEVLDTLDDDSAQLIARALKDPTGLAKQIWQDVWSVSGATPENCLYTFVELFIFKYLSDLQVLAGQYSFRDLLSRYASNSEEDVLENYAQVVRPRIKALFPKNSTDNTTIINGTIFVSKDEQAVRGYSSVFRKILERFDREGQLDNIHHDFKSKLFESFLKESISKKNWGQFFTPLKVVRAIVSMCDIRDGMSICDPACGVGKFLLEPVLNQLSRFYHVTNGQLSWDITLRGYDKGFDKDEQKTIILAKANMLIYFSDLVRKWPMLSQQFASLFNASFQLETNSILGTLAKPSRAEFDLILTNPPYVTSGSSNLKDEIKKTGLESHYNVPCLGVEGLFLQWIIKALKPGGQAFVVIPDGVLNRIPDRELRRFILKECFVDALLSLPSRTFFTTSKKTTILKITRKRQPSEQQTHPVMAYIVSDIGETLDTYRFETGNNQLEDAALIYNQFKGAKSSFATDDRRCKLLPVSYFEGRIDGSWLVEDAWQEEEKIDLGLEQHERSVTVAEFGGLLGDTAAAMETYQQPIADIAAVASEYVFKEVSIQDPAYFVLSRGKRITRRTVNANRGTVPVYSSSKSEGNVLGHISEQFLRNHNRVLFTKPAVLVNIDGSVGHCFVRREPKYSFIDVVAAVQPATSDIDLDYLKIALQERLKQVGATYQTKLYFGKMTNYGVTVRIPVKDDGSFDLDAQQELARRYLAIEEVLRDLANKFRDLSELSIDFG